MAQLYKPSHAPKLMLRYAYVSKELMQGKCYTSIMPILCVMMCIWSLHSKVLCSCTCDNRICTSISAVLYARNKHSNDSTSESRYAVHNLRFVVVTYYKAILNINSS